MDNDSNDVSSKQNHGQFYLVMIRLIERLKQLQAENEQLRKDAERYRFLRDKANANKDNPFISILNNGVFSQWTGENADEAIDKAKAETK